MSRDDKYKVHLVAYDLNGTVAEEAVLTTEDYYEGDVPLIDDGALRVRRGVARIVGKIFGTSAKPDQVFENVYAEDGHLVRTRTVHADGTVT